MSTATFRGTYTANGGEDYAAGTVSVTPYGGSTSTATLDGSGHYSVSPTLVLSSSAGLWLNATGEVVSSAPTSGSVLIAPGGVIQWTKCRVVETITGAPDRSYVVDVQAGDVIDTGRDVGTVLGGSSSGLVLAIDGGTP